VRIVDVLFFTGCPHAELAIERARNAVVRSGIAAEVRLLLVETTEEAEKHGFLGSPTIRVDGVDVEPAARGRRQFGIQCRLYSDAGSVSGAPSMDWIEAALRGKLPRS
jgi:hypothetical protein